MKMFALLTALAAFATGGAPASAGGLLDRPGYHEPNINTIPVEALAANAARQAEEARIRAEVQNQLRWHCNSRSMFDKSPLPDFCR